MTGTTDVRRDPTPMPEGLNRTATVTLIIGALLLLPSLFLDIHRTLANWLVFFVFMLTLGMGALFLVALEYTVNARWSVPFRRISEHLAGLVPLSLVLAVPVLLGMHHLYEWTHADVVANDPVLMKKAAYLNIPFFVIRLAAYFLIWLLFYRLFIGASRKQDHTGDEDLTRQGIKLAPPFMILFAFTMSFAGIDLMMSLTPHWFSSIFGPYVAVSAVVGGLALTTLVSVLLKMRRMLPDSVGPDHFYNLGALLFGMNTFRAYLAFSQFLLIWYANLPAEMAWYTMRQTGGWLAVSVLMIPIQFVVPFLALLSRPAKMDLNRLRWVSIWVLAAHLLDLYWIVLPGIPHLHPLSWMDLWMPFAAVGLGLLVWRRQAARAPLVAARDPRLESGLAFHL